MAADPGALFHGPWYMFQVGLTSLLALELLLIYLAEYLGARWWLSVFTLGIPRPLPSKQLIGL